MLKDLLGKSEEIRKEMASHNKADFVAEEEPPLKPVSVTIGYHASSGKARAASGSTKSSFKVPKT